MSPMRDEHEQTVELGRGDDLYRLLAALGELAGDDTVLYLEGNHIAPDVRAFLEARPATASTPVKRGTIWPRPKSFHLPLTRANLAGLRELAENHAEPEICDHLVVYRGDRLLLEAYDAGNNTVWVATDLPPDTLAGLRRALGLE
jgi:hypothetical protein